MRSLFASLWLLSFLALSACGSENQARDRFREASIEGCRSAAQGQPAPPGLAGFDWDRLCTCATDRIMEGKSAADLAQLEPGGPGQREAVEQCIGDMMSGTAPGATTNGAQADVE